MKSMNIHGDIARLRILLDLLTGVVPMASPFLVDRLFGVGVVTSFASTSLKSCFDRNQNNKNSERTVKETINGGYAPRLGLHGNGERVSDVNVVEDGWVRLCRGKRRKPDDTHLTLHSRPFFTP